MVIGLSVAVTACQSPTPATFSLTIAGAASLTGALRDIELAYEASVPGADLVIATDSSAALRTQIEEGAQVDVFLSADTTNPDRLVEDGLTLGDQVTYAGNSLALLVPADNPAGIQSPADLANEGVQIIAAGDEVPITAYTRQLVANLAALPGYPADFAERYAANVVSQEDNVKGIVVKIEEGVGDAGFVYRTDALASDHAASFELPQEANVLAVYAGVVVATTEHPHEARAFLDWLVGPDGQAILTAFGFVIP